MVSNDTEVRLINKTILITLGLESMTPCPISEMGWLCYHVSYAIAISENLYFWPWNHEKKNSDIIPPSENNHLDEAQVKKKH